MEIRRRNYNINNVIIPSYETRNQNENLVIIIHGYGGNKEEIIGLSLAIANSKFDTITLDLRGHGESKEKYSKDIINDINCIINVEKKDYKNIITIGHSLGGRLALISNADIRIGISPALPMNYTEQTKNIIKNLRNYRVQINNPDDNFTILSILNEYKADEKKKDFFIWCEKDVPEIKKHCLEIQSENSFVIPEAFHNDVFINELTIRKIIEILS